MWHVIEGAARVHDDIAAALGRLDNLREHPAVFVRDLFAPGRDLVVTRVPRTVELAGGMAGHLGGRSIHWPLGDAVFVTLQRDERRDLRILAPVRLHPQDADRFELPLSYFERGDRAVTYDVARDYFRRDPDRGWATPMAGLILAMMREQDARFREGLRVLVEASSDQGPPVGGTPWTTAGLLWALHAGARRLAPPRAVAQLAQRPWLSLTHDLVDPGTLLCGLAGTSGELIVANGSPGDIESRHRLAADLHIWCLVPKAEIAAPVPREALRHFHLTALIAYRAIASLAKLPHRVTPTGHVHVTDRAWRGTIANIDPGEFRSRFEPDLPEAATGASLFERFGESIFMGLPVEPHATYGVRLAARYIVDEQQRHRLTLDALTRGGPSVRVLQRVFDESSAQAARALGLSVTAATSDDQAPRTSGRGVMATRLAWSGVDSVWVVVGDCRARDEIGGLESRYWILGGSSHGAITQGHLRLRSIKSAVAS